jgi:large subunit ribosomal protein L10
MAKTRVQKAVIIDTLAEALKGSASAVFVHFKAVNMTEEYAMRRALTAAGVKYYITRKTLMKKAAEKSGVTGTMPHLTGEVAIAYGMIDAAKTDITLSPRGVQEYVRKLNGKLSIVGGILEGKFADAAEMQVIATIPPLNVLRGMFVNVINSPIQGLVVALSKIAEAKEAK